MFSNKEVDAYMKISAPEELKVKVEKSTLKRKHKSPLSGPKMVAVIAACVILVISLNTFLGKPSLNIVVNGYELDDKVVFYDVSPAADMRISPIYSVPVEINIDEEARLTVSHGKLTVNDGTPTEYLEIYEDAMIWWNIERNEKMPECEMEIEHNGKTTFIILTFNDADKTITAKRIVK